LKLDIDSSLLLATSEPHHAANIPQATLHRTTSLLATLRYTSHNSVARRGHGSARLRDVPSFVVLATTLGSVHSLTRCKVSDGLTKTALSNLAGNEVVDAVLEGIDLLDTRDFGLVERVCN
jgi:hypothetical protein